MEEQRSDPARMNFELAQDDGDKSVDEHERHMQSRMQSMLSQQLDDIEQALEKIAEGSYGTCEECGQDIPLQRLAIQPSASYCVACQERLEKTGPKDNLWNQDSNPSEQDRYTYLPDEE